MEAVSEADNVTLAFMNRFGRFILQNAHKKCKMGLPFSYFRIQGHRRDLGDRGRFRGLRSNFGIYEPICLFYTSKYSQKYIKGGYLSYLLGFEVTEWI